MNYILYNKLSKYIFFKFMLKNMCSQEINSRGGIWGWGWKYLLGLLLTYFLLTKILAYFSPDILIKLVNCNFA